MYDHSAALLPTTTRMNPRQPEDARYYNKDQVAFVIQDGKRFRVATSFGELSGWHIGSVHEVRHDQTSRWLGDFTVVGIANFRTGEFTGEVPNRKLAHWVFK